MRTLVLILGFLVGIAPVVNAQSAGTEPPMGLDELSAYSIFYENYKNEEYESAVKYGRWIFKAMPRKLKGYSKFDLERNLERLIKAYGELAKKKEDPTLRSAYADTALIIFDKVFEEFSEDQIDTFEWKIRRGRFLQDHADFIDNGLQKAYEQYRELFAENPKRTTEFGDGYYIQVTIQHLVSQGEKDQALQMIEKAEPYATEENKEFFDQVRNQLFDSPAERMAFLEEKLKENPEDTELLNELAGLYEQEQMNDKAKETYEKLYKLNPNFDNTMAMAEFAINNASYGTAIRFLKEAMDKTEDKTKKGEIALKLSDAYKNNENLQQARSYARQAANFRPNWGRPYLQIASIYSQAVNNCTSGRKMEREDKVVYWLVLDYLDKAKRVDQSVANEVQRQYRSYEPVTPTTEEKFFKGWEEGDKMKVDKSLVPCYDWINETTTVR